ncbi:MAG: metallophosphoesterase family protein [Faecalibacterium sp.]|nr:metallophosphoesterase family protein [Faecalibacterium sp.]
MKILALADEPSKLLWDFDTRKALEGVELILSAGDLPADYLEYLTNFTAAPILYVHGNHDGKTSWHEPGGCFCIEDSVYVWRGLRILGLGGCIRYNLQSTYQYTEKEMAHRIKKLHWQMHWTKGFDILLAHSPARGLNDQEDPAHRGFACFNELLEQYQPGWFVHGHVHLQYNQALPRICTHGATTVINASERYLFEIPDELIAQRMPQRAKHLF